MLRPLTILAACLLAACSEKPAAAAPKTIAAPPDLWREFSGEKALAETQRQVDFGPRPSGSSALEKARQHIIQTLKTNGWETERQELELHENTIFLFVGRLGRRFTYMSLAAMTSKMTPTSNMTPANSLTARGGPCGPRARTMGFSC